MPDTVSKERRAEYNRRFREQHPDYWKKWNKENAEKRREYQRRYFEKNGYEPNPESIKKAVNAYHGRPLGRAQNLVTSYRQFDRSKGWETALTSERVKELITTRSCIYCGCDNWEELGLDRISNDRPHSTFNVVVCCKKCNIKRNRKTFGEFLDLLGLDPYKDIGFEDAEDLKITY